MTNEQALKEATFDAITWDHIVELRKRMGNDEKSEEFQRLTEIILMLGKSLMAMDGETVH